MHQIRIRRSVLFVPGSNARALEKARTVPCDVVALDLEDSVAPQAKHAAREAVCAAVKHFAPREVVVRINSLSSPWGQDDLAALQNAPDAILLPKVGDAADVAAAESGIPVWAMIETPSAILNLDAIAASGAAVLVMGTNDLLKEMRAAATPLRENLWSALSQTVIAARAYGLDVIDGTYNAIGDEPGLAAECAQGKAFGFDGKSLIHPAQIDAANRIFGPGVEEIAQARHIAAMFERPENQDKGVLALDGRMIERLHVQSALRTLALADAIAARGT